MALAWLLFTAVAFYTCVKPECCLEPTEVITPAAVSDDYGIVTRSGADDILTGSQWPALRDRLVTEFRNRPDDNLDVYGYYYAGEPTPDGYENMGFARAAEIADVIARETDIPRDRMNLLSRLRSGDRPEGEELWRAGEFNWSATTTDENASEVVELENDEIVIRFPFDESTKQLEARVTDYLDKLAERLQQTNERVTITGHTDNIDTDAYNMKLGQRRADFVRDYLVRKGAPAARITTRSEGESNPTATNATSAGRAKNRRAEVQLAAQ